MTSAMLTAAEEYAKRLRDRCKPSQTCAAIVRDLLGGMPAPLTDRQRERLIQGAAIHWAASTCARCAMALADAPPEVAERVRRRAQVLGRRAGLAPALADLIVTVRKNRKAFKQPAGPAAGKV